MLHGDLYSIVQEVSVSIIFILLGIGIGILGSESDLSSATGVVTILLYLLLLWTSFKDLSDINTKKYMGREETPLTGQRLSFWSKTAQRNIILLAILSIPAGWLFNGL